MSVGDSDRAEKARKTNMKKDIKNWVIGILTVAIVILLGVILNLKRTYDLWEYAIANDCTWTWQGTMYGDDRDYICK